MDADVARLERSSNKCYASAFKKKKKKPRNQNVSFLFKRKEIVFPLLYSKFENESEVKMHKLSLATLQK